MNSGSSSFQIDPDDVDWSDLEAVRRFDRQLDDVPIDAVKRTVDVVLSGLLLFFFAPVFLGTWIYNTFKNLFVREKPADLFHRETRISQGDRFDILKFRVLKPKVLRTAREKDDLGHVKQLEKDPATLSAMGQILVRTYLDELPQLWNVFTGDMSFVGPRPWPLPLYENEKERRLRRKELIRPGLTGPDQVAKGFSEMYGEQKEGDYRYIHYHGTHGSLACFFYDLRLIVLTIAVLLRAEGK